MKNSLLFSALFAIAGSFSIPASAAPILYQGVDISPMVTHLQKQVKTLNQQIYVYNWSANGGDPNANFQGAAEQWARTFWSEFGRGGLINTYGLGLYAAADPVATVDYGGGNNSWLLLEMKLPAGLKLVDLGERSTLTVSEDYRKIAQQFKCPSYGNPDSLFSFGGELLQPECQKLVQEIYQKILKVDILAYSYTHTQFKDCANTYESSKAFLIIDSKWMKADSVQYYTSFTKDNLEGRIRIQTLFLKSNPLSNETTRSDMMTAVTAYLDTHPTSNLRGSTTKCEDDKCIITVHLCDPANHCDDVNLPQLHRPFGPLITSREAATIPLAPSLLWPDLEGKPKTPTISTWLKDNKYACSGQLPYKENSQP